MRIIKGNPLSLFLLISLLCINYFCCCTLLFTNALFSGMVSAISISRAFDPEGRAKQGGHHLLAPLECVNIGRGSLFSRMVEYSWCDQEWLGAV